MSSNRVAKRKVEEAIPEVDQEEAKKRAKKGDESDHEGVEVGAVGSDDEEYVDDDELAGLDTSNVIPGGRKTRGVRVDYSKLKGDEEEEDEEEEEEEEVEEEHQGSENDDEVAKQNGEVAEAVTVAKPGNPEEAETGTNGTSEERNEDGDDEE